MASGSADPDGRHRMRELLRRRGKSITSTNQSTRWAVWFAVSGDLRFLSHHDLMRLMARAVARANVPVKFTEGFNPRPKLSLSLPRPVGVASRSELMVAELTEDVNGESFAADLAAQLPAGAEVLRCDPLPPGKPPEIVSADYEVAAAPERAEAVAARLAALAEQDQWPVTRAGKARRGRPARSRTLDIKPSVRDLRLEGGRLRFTVLNAPSGAARCDELLGLLGLGENAEVLAGITRTSLECRFQRRIAHGRNGES